jgi:hypothetical protein
MNLGRRFCAVGLFTLLLAVSGLAQWTRVASGISYNLRAVKFVTPSVAYVVGDSGVVLKSADAGNTRANLPTGGVIPSIYFSCTDAPIPVYSRQGSLK